MEGIKNNSNIKYVLIIIGLVALALSYFLGYKGYQTDISDIKDEISSLETRYNDLKTKESKRKEYEKNKKEADEKFEEILLKYDAGLSTKRIIMDCHNIASSSGLSLTSLSLSEPKLFWAFGTEKKDGKVNNKDTNTYEMMASARTYSIQATGTYNNIKDLLDKILSEKSKRRVPVCISFAFDPTLNTTSCNISITEYAVIHKDRNESESIIPKYTQGIENIFFNSLAPNSAQ